MKKVFTVLLSAAILILPLAGCDRADKDLTAQNTGSLTSGGAASDAGAVVSGSASNADYAAAQAINLAEGKSIKIDKGGYYSAVGVLADGQIVIDCTEKVYLQLAGAEITNKSGPAIQVDNAKEITLTLKAGTLNKLTDGGANQLNAALFSNDTLTIEGDGSLEITGNNEHGIESDDDVIINGGEIAISAKNDAIHANDNITVNSGKVTVLSSVEGIESKGDIIVNGGVISVSASDDGLNAATDITINGGQTYANSSRGDALDSNGTININGGTVVALGAAQPEAGIDNDRNTLNITGGLLFAAGGSNSVPTAASSTQCAVMLGVPGQSKTLHLEGPDGAVLTFVAEQALQSVVFSSPLLEKGKSYTVYTGGTVTGGSSFCGLYSGGEYSGGTKGESFTIEETLTVQGGNTGMMGGGRMPGGRMQGGRMPADGNPPAGTPPVGEAPTGDMPRKTAPDGAERPIAPAR